MTPSRTKAFPLFYIHTAPTSTGGDFFVESAREINNFAIKNILRSCAPRGSLHMSSNNNDNYRIMFRELNHQKHHV